MGHDEVFIPFAVAAITPLGCAWVASRFVPPTNKWVYGGVVIGTAYLSWNYIVPRMLTSMGYPVPFDAESFSAEDCSHSNKIVDNVDEQGRHTNWPYWICTDCGKDWDYDAFCPQCGKANCPDKNECNGLLAAESFAAVPSGGTGSPGQMCEVCNESDDLPYDSDHFKECRRCGKSVCHECWDTDIESDEHYYEICGECWIVLDNVARYDAESFSAEPGWVSGPDAEPYPDEIDESLLEEYQQVIAEWEVVEGTPPSFKEYFNEAYWKAKEKYDRAEEIAHNEYMEYLSTLTVAEAMEEMYGAETTATQRKWRIVKEYPHDITKEQHDEIIEALDYNDPNKEIFYVRYGDTIRILTPHAPINPILNGSFLPTFSAESFGADGPSRPCNAPDCNNPCYAKAQGQLSEGKPVMRYPYLCEECIIKFHPDVGAESFSAEQKKNECCERFTAWANGWGMTEEGKEKWNEWFVPKGDQSLQYQGIAACPFCGLHFHDKVRTRGAESFAAETNYCYGCGLSAKYVPNQSLEEIELWDREMRRDKKAYSCSDCYDDLVYGAESKFIRPYDGKHGIKLERDNKGRYRRKLSVPLKKR